jgi:protein-disulfide isomerase
VRRWLGLLVELGVVALVIVLGIYAFERASRTSDGEISGPEGAVAANADEVFRSPRSVVAGNPEGDVTIVAFYDYNCPDCRKDAPALEALVARDGDVRLVLKELPVLGPDSEDAAAIALAAKRQGEPYALHQRLMRTKGRVTKARALAIADELGLDVERLKREMADPSITAALLANRRLANDLGVRGVPFYLVGDRVVPEGDGNFYADLKDRVADVRLNGCRAAC